MVYVDNMRAKYGRMIMCHMVADTLEELHTMADTIGVNRKWFQISKSGYPHYDISLAKKKIALENGAIIADKTVIIQKCKELKEEYEGKI